MERAQNNLRNDNDVSVNVIIVNKAPVRIITYLKKLGITPIVKSPFFISSKKNIKCPLLHQKVSGVYLLIGNFKSDFVEYPIYIGGSCLASGRIKAHFIDLAKNKHKNQVLQRAFNKEGGKFYAYLLETCMKSDVMAREQFYLDTIRPFLSEGRGYNMEKKAKRLDFPNRGAVKEAAKQKISEKNSRPFSVINPQGELIKGNNLTQFCKLNNLQPSLLCAVLSGRRKAHKGYRKNTRRNLGVPFKKDIQKRLFQTVLVHSGQQIFVKSLRKFAKENNLPYQKLSRELRVFGESLGYKIYE